MGKRKRKKGTSFLTWKTLAGTFRLLSQGLVKSTPLFTLVLLGFAAFWGIRGELYADPGFTVRNVEISPAGVLSPERIQELERIFLGQNLFKVSLRDAAERLERDPQIREARISRHFPKALRLDISPRLPFAQIRVSSNGPLYTAGEDGFVLNSGWVRDDKLLLVDAVDLDLPKPAVGSRPSLSGYAEGVALVREFWNHPLGQSESLVSLRLNRLGEATLVLRDGPELRFGRQPLRKFNSLEAALPLLEGPERDRLVYIEFQYPDLIVKKKETR